MSATKVEDGTISLAARYDPAGGRFTYAYDGAGRSASLVNPQGERTTWTYDLDRPAAMLLANGTRTSYTHDAAGQTRAVIHRRADGTIFSSFEYDYDPAGNRTSVQEADGARVTWTYDATNQLIRERRSGSQSYDVTHTYDPAGNRTLANADGARTTYTYNQANELTVVDGAEGSPLHFAHDGAGNLVEVYVPDEPENLVIASLGWDDENRLTSHHYTPPSGTLSTYAYHGDGRRVLFQQGANEKRFLWDGENVLLERDGDGLLQAIYTLEPALYGNLISQRRASATTWYHADALGSTDRMTDAAEAIVNRYLYQAFGDELLASQSVINPFRYVGRLGYYYDGTEFAPWPAPRKRVHVV